MGWMEKNPFRENEAWVGRKEVRLGPSVNNNNTRRNILLLQIIVFSMVPYALLIDIFKARFSMHKPYYTIKLLCFDVKLM